MKEKQIQLLKILEKEQTPVTSLILSKSLNVSVRTIKNYVKELNEMYGSRIVNSSRKGYSLDNKITINILLSNKDEKLPQTLEDRGNYIFQEFISGQLSNLDIYELSDTLYISETTLINTVDHMNSEWASDDISFTLSKGILKIRGHEKNIRKAIIKFINRRSKGNLVDDNILQSNFPFINVANLIKITRQTFNRNKVNHNNFSSFSFYLHLLIIIDRIKKDRHLNNIHRNLEFNESPVIENYIHNIENEYNLDFNIFEKNEVYFLVFTFIDNFSNDNLFKKSDSNAVDNILPLVRYYIDKINDIYLVDLSSQEFIKSFSYHLESLINRVTNNSSINNPMAEIIKQNNPMIYDMAVFICIDFMERFNIILSQDEISFIAMHIGAEIQRQEEPELSERIAVVIYNPSYREVNDFFINKLKETFSDTINIVQLNKTESEINNTNADLLISTVSLEKLNINFPYIQVSPLLSEKDFSFIKSSIEMINHKHKISKLKKLFEQFLHTELFFLDDNERNYYDVINRMSNKMYDLGFVKENFTEEVLKRERAATTAFENFAIPHSSILDSHKTYMGIFLSSDGISWGSRNVNLVFLIAVNEKDIVIFREMYESLITIFDSQVLLNELIDSKTIEEFIEKTISFLSNKGTM